MARLLHVPLALILCGAIPAGLKAGPIHDAAFFGKIDTIQSLLDGGADIDERDTFDRTALHRAAGKASPEVVEFLIVKGADVHARFKLQKDTALFTAIAFGREAIVTLHSNKQLYIDPESATGTRIYRARVAD